MSRIVLTERWVVLLQVQFIAPVANGAGVSLIMAYLNGNSIPDLLTFRSASQMYPYEAPPAPIFYSSMPIRRDHVTGLHNAQAHDLQDAAGEVCRHLLRGLREHLSGA